MDEVVLVSPISLEVDQQQILESEELSWLLHDLSFWLVLEPFDVVLHLVTVECPY